MHWSRLALAALVVVGCLTSACELLDDSPSAQGAVAPTTATAIMARPSPTRPIVSVPSTPSTSTPDSEPTATPLPASPTVAPSPSPTRPAATLVARSAASGYRRFTSSRLPYAIDYLETWQAGAPAPVEGGQGDLFVGDRTGSPSSSVTVITLPLSQGMSPRLVLESSLAELAEANIRPDEEIERTVDGNDAFVVNYAVTRNDRAYQVTQAIVVAGDTAWVLTLTTMPEEAERLRPVFSHMLDSFQAQG